MAPLLYKYNKLKTCFFVYYNFLIIQILFFTIIFKVVTKILKFNVRSLDSNQGVAGHESAALPLSYLAFMETSTTGIIF